MKKRILAWFLALTLVVGGLPTVVLANSSSSSDPNGTTFPTDPNETVLSEQPEDSSTPTITIQNKQIVATVDGNSTNYTLRFGRPTNDGSYTTGSISKIIDDPQTVTSTNWYLLLQDSSGNEPSREIYDTLWATCTITLRDFRTDTENVSYSEIMDGNTHKYITTTICGTYSGRIVNVILRIGENTTGVTCEANILIPSPLSLDESGHANFTIENAQAYSYYCFSADLGEEKAAQVSAELTTENVYGRIDLDGGDILWRYFEDDTAAVSWPQSVTAQRVVFLVCPFSGGNISGTIKVEAEQPGLMFRYMEYNGTTWVESTRSLQDIRNLTSIALNKSLRVRLYYGTNASSVPVSSVVSNNPDVIGVTTETAADGGTFYSLSAKAFGTAELTCITGDVTTSCAVTVGPPVYGFYSAAERSEANHLPSVDLNGTNAGLTAIWFISEGSMASIKENITVKAGDTPVTNTEWSDDHTLKITLPTDIEDTVYWIYVYNGTKRLGLIRVTQPEQPGLMFRSMDFNDVTWVESTRPLQAVSNLTFDKLNDSKRVRLYYGTSTSAVSVSSIVSNNSDVIGVTTETAADNKIYYVLTANGFGSATLSVSDGDMTEQFTATVDLPSYGFYSANARTVEKYLPEVVLTGEETDLTEIWFIGKNSIGDGIVVKANGIDITSKSASVGDTALKITLPDDITSSVYELSVYRGDGKLRGTMVRQPGGSQSGGDSGQNGYASYIGDYVIGFAEKRADGEVTKICENADKIFGHGTIENTSPDVPYRKEVDIRIAAATKSEDTTGTVIYTVDPDVTNSVVIKRLWVETHSGDNTTYSWSGDSLVTELTSVQEESVPLYVKAGRNCEATICAQIAVTVGEQTYEKTVRMNIGLTIIGFSGLTRPDNDTVEQLNAFLAELAEQINTTDSTNEIYHIELGSTTYEGTIHVPAAFKRGQACLHFVGTARNGRQTVVKGGLDVNGAFIEYIKDIHFVADESSADQTRAIFGGGLRTVGNCSFYGYDIALDSSEGLINANSSVFVNNEIAALVNVNDSMDYNNVLPGDWSSNTFINNGTAVQILSLTKRVSPYYFRIYDSNFINNGTDIDARCGGTLYMYRNYFGQYKEYNGHRPHPGKYHHDHRNGREHLRLDELLNARTEPKLHSILDYARAKIHTENETEVVTNPRWQHPVKDWWSHNSLVNDTFFGPEPASYEIMTLDEEEEYEDVQVADWEDKTIILNEESNGLRLDASAFNSTGDKEIGVVDENEETLGIWNFD